jgi:hypothetical protein
MHTKEVNFSTVIRFLAILFSFCFFGGGGGGGVGEGTKIKMRISLCPLESISLLHVEGKTGTEDCLYSEHAEQNRSK